MLVDHVIPFFSAFACVLVTLAAPWHVKARNTAIILLLAWLFVANFVIMLNAFIWWSNTSVSGAVWCDISAKLQPAWSMGVPCANTCLARRLYAIASTKASTLPNQRRRSALIVDLIIAILVPLIYAALTIVYQGHRYDIVEGIGCLPAVVVSTPYIVLGVLPPLVAFFINLLYSILSIRYFLIRQKQFSAVLNSSGSTMNKSRYIRMMALCLVEIAINLPVLIITQCLAIATYKANFVPYSWYDVHYGFNAVVRYDATLFSIPGGHRAFISYTLGRWVAPFSSFLVFLFFGLNKDAVEEYKSIANAIKRHIPFLKAAPPSRQAASRLGNSQSVQYTHEMPHLGMHEMNSSQTFADHSKDSPATPLSYSTSHQDDKPLTGVGMRIDHVVT